MNLRSTLLLLLWLIVGLSRLEAQTQAANPDDAVPAGSTVITSDELRSDQVNHTSVFSGSVTVVGTNFTLTCEELTVIFTKDGKVDNITASGNVVITQPGRIARSGRAQYFREDDRFVLTDQPVIIENKNQVSSAKITIFRTKQTTVTEGRTKTIINNSGIGATSPAGTP